MLTAGDVWTDFIKSRDQSLREKLILQYAPLVRYVIERLAISFPMVMDRDDIYQCGILGLIRCIDRFEPGRKVKFETYAISRIRGAILDELRTLDPVPRSTRKKAKEIERAYAELQDELGRPATGAEVAKHLGMTTDALDGLILQLSSTTISLDSTWRSEDGGDAVTLAELIEDASSPDPQQLVERKELVEALTHVLGQLPKREKLVLALYYHEGLTLREISKVMDLSESRVCQLHTQSILRLRALLNLKVGRPTRDG